MPVANIAAPPAAYDARAEGYAAHRRLNPAVLQALLDNGALTAETRVLDVGCGTGNYGAALTELTGCLLSGIDPSAKMLERARTAAPWENLVRAGAEALPFGESSFDLVMSTDVIHHVADRDAYFGEAVRVLRPGGRIVTVTDSHDVIPLRQPLSNFFPETIAIELGRYPPVPRLVEEMRGAGLIDADVVEVQYPYDLVDVAPFRNKVFSSLLLIEEEAFRRGMDRLETALAEGPIPCVSRYTMIWGTRPRST